MDTARDPASSRSTSRRCCVSARSPSRRCCVSAQRTGRGGVALAALATWLAGAGCVSSTRWVGADAVATLLLEHCVAKAPRAESTAITLEGESVPLVVTELKEHVLYGSNLWWGGEAVGNGMRCSLSVPGAASVDRARLVKHLIRVLGPPTFYFVYRGATSETEGGTSSMTVLPLDDDGSRLTLELQDRTLNIQFRYHGPDDIPPLRHFADRRALPGFEQAVATRFESLRAALDATRKKIAIEQAVYQRELDAIRLKREAREAQEEAERRESEAANQQTILDAIARGTTYESPRPPGVGPDWRPIEQGGTGGPGLTMTTVPKEQTTQTGGDPCDYGITTDTEAHFACQHRCGGPGPCACSCNNQRKAEWNAQHPTCPARKPSDCTEAPLPASTCPPDAVERGGCTVSH